MDDLISRDFIKSLGGECIAARDSKTHELLPISSIDALPSAQPQDIARDIATIIENEKDMRVIAKNAQLEQLTDKEQRIFLAAMAREEKICKQVDDERRDELYEDSLVWVCREIMRKVKAALWET